jgi:3,4-dihydroxy 2-butanone 4-phosphate synthase / GTP cyclohydrolase II
MSDFKDALADFKAGKFVIVTDSKDREDEGDLIAKAGGITTEQIAFMVRHTSGVICAALTSEIAKNLKLPMMVANNEDNHTTAFTVSVDLIKDRTTGISAKERANTLRALASSNAKSDQFLRPGHIFPLVAVDGGLVERAGHTEAGVALCNLTNTYPVAVICELVNDDGTMMRGQLLTEFANQHNIKKISIEEIIENSPKAEIKKAATSFTWAKLPMADKDWQITTYRSQNGADHAVLSFGKITGENLLTRIHSECLTGDVFGSARCDCGAQLAQSIDQIERSGSGLIIYLKDHEGRGIGLAEKVKAYALQDSGLDTVAANLSLGHLADERNYIDAVAIIKALGINSIKLLTNNPAKTQALDQAGIKYSRVELITTPTAHNLAYLNSKAQLLKHKLGGSLDVK